MTKNNGKSWLMFIIMYYSTAVTMFAQLKISPILGDVADLLHVTVTQAALLNSAFSFAGLILAIPGSAIMAKVGAKKMFRVCLIAVLCGNLLGAVSSNLYVILVSRVIEGTAAAFSIPLGITGVNQWFEGPTVGTCSGIFNTTGAIGNFVAMNACVAISASFGPKAVWWACVILAAIALVAGFLFVDFPADNIVKNTDGASDAEKPATLGEALKNPWLLCSCGAMAFMSLILYTFMNTYPLMFQSYGVSVAKAAFYASLMGIFGIFTSILAGALFGRSKDPFMLVIGCTIACAVVCFFIPHLPNSPVAFITHVALVSLLPAGMIMTFFMIIPPRMAPKPSMIGIIMCVQNVVYQLGAMVSTPLAAKLAGSNASPASWTTCSFVLIGSCAVVVFFLCLMRPMYKKIMDERAAKQAE